MEPELLGVVVEHVHQAGSQRLPPVRTGPWQHWSSFPCHGSWARPARTGRSPGGRRTRPFPSIVMRRSADSFSSAIASSSVSAPGSVTPLRQYPACRAAAWRTKPRSSAAGTSARVARYSATSSVTCPSVRCSASARPSAHRQDRPSRCPRRASRDEPGRVGDPAGDRVPLRYQIGPFVIVQLVVVDHRVVQQPSGQPPPQAPGCAARRCRRPVPRSAPPAGRRTRLRPSPWTGRGPRTAAAPGTGLRTSYSTSPVVLR